jgi:AcrR family transcriptional regulator
MPPKARLTTAQVTESAASLLQSGGIEALTLHNLAKTLGVQTPSLYNHVDGMPGLLRELRRLNARQLESCMIDAALGNSGAPALTCIAQAYREYIKTYPDLYTLTLRASGSERQPDAELAALEARTLQVVLAVLRSFDLQGEDTLHAARGLRSLVHGFATLEVAGGFGLPLDCDESFRRLVELFIQGLENFREQVAGANPSA